MKELQKNALPKDFLIATQKMIFKITELSEMAKCPRENQSRLTLWLSSVSFPYHAAKAHTGFLSSTSN